jgi:hypothetical protein
VKASLRRSTFIPFGSVRIAIHEAETGTHDPAEDSLTQVSLSVSSLEDYFLWHEVAFGEDVAKLPVGVGYTVAIRGSLSSAETRIEYHKITDGTYDDGFECRYSEDGGDTWKPSSENLTWDDRIYVFGKYIVLGGDGSVDSGTLRMVHIHLEAFEGETEAVLHGAVQCVNTPDLTGLPYDDLPLLSAS